MYPRVSVSALIGFESITGTICLTLPHVNDPFLLVSSARVAGIAYSGKPQTSRRRPQRMVSYSKIRSRSCACGKILGQSWLNFVLMKRCVVESLISFGRTVMTSCLQIQVTLPKISRVSMMTRPPKHGKEGSLSAAVAPLAAVPVPVFLLLQRSPEYTLSILSTLIPSLTRPAH